MRKYEGKTVEEEEEELRRTGKKVQIAERLQITEPMKIKVKEEKKLGEVNATIWVGCESDESRRRVRRQLLVQ